MRERLCGRKVTFTVTSVGGEQIAQADIIKNLTRAFGNLANQGASAVEDAMAVVLGAARTHLDAEFSFSISAQPLPDISRELVVNVGRVHRFRVPPSASR